MQKIAILSSAGIGDTIILGPLLKKLKAAYPVSSITVLSRRGGFMENYPIRHIDKMIRLDSIVRILGSLRERHDLLIGLGYYSNINGHINALLYRLFILLARAVKKIYHGELDAEAFKGKNMVRIELDILKKLGIEIKESDYNIFVPFSFDAEKEKIKEILDGFQREDKPFTVTFHVGVKKGYFTRSLPEAKWISAIERLHEKYGARMIFAGSAGDAAPTGEVARSLSFPVLDLTGKLSVKETTALIDETDIFVSTNSGPMWIAAALGKPQVAVCGPSKFAWEPYNEKAIVIRKVINRKHCLVPCDSRKCRYGDNLCMESIKPEDIVEAVDNLAERLEKP